MAGMNLVRLYPVGLYPIGLHQARLHRHGVAPGRISLYWIASTWKCIHMGLHSQKIAPNVIAPDRLHQAPCWIALGRIAPCRIAVMILNVVGLHPAEMLPAGLHPAGLHLAGLQHHRVVLTWGCTHRGLHPQRIEPKWDCTHTVWYSAGFHPHRSAGVTYFTDLVFFIIFSESVFLVPAFLANHLASNLFGVTFCFLRSNFF